MEYEINKNYFNIVPEVGHFWRHKDSNGEVFLRIRDDQGAKALGISDGSSFFSLSLVDNSIKHTRINACDIVLLEQDKPATFKEIIK